MVNARLLLVLTIVLISTFSFLLINLFLGPSFTGLFVGFGPPQVNFTWWNISWNYRFRLEINATQYSRADWPIELQVNFTDLLPSGTFDENSTRILEYNSTGGIIQEATSQFDKGELYNAASNAVGTLSFIMNGTTAANNKRIFYIYYDSVQNGVKQNPGYSTNLIYNWNGEEFNVNTTVFAFWGDTIRGENVSGLYKIIGKVVAQPIWPNEPASNERTLEYSEYSNGTHNFSFDFRNNATFPLTGPVRLVLEQRGNEVIWNSTNLTNQGYVVKKYIFYDKLPWIRIETNFTNLGGFSIDRNSTFAGAIAVDALRAYGAGWQDIRGNTTQPGWWFAADSLNNYHTGIIHFNQSGTTNYWVQNSTGKDRIGIHLNLTTISASSSIIEQSVMHFNNTNPDFNQVRDLRDRLATPVFINQSLPEERPVYISPFTNASIYNRNETMLIIGNLSASDFFNLTKKMNATLDMGTPAASDDQTIVLYDDGTNGDQLANDKQFTNIFGINNSANVSVWTINFTAYTNLNEFLNSTTRTFNVTDVYNVTATVTNPNKRILFGSTGFANIDARNYRLDTWIAGATINCSYDSTEITNKTDWGNGTYSVNFSAPSPGNYILSCNATKAGNFGNDTDIFTVETAKTNVSIVSIPQNPFVSNVRLFYNDSFVITANGSNVGNGTAYSTNISLELLSGWGANSTLEQCGDVNINSYCQRGFNITVPNGTSPGNYYINVTAVWRNPDDTTSSNKTQVNVTVQSNPRVDVDEASIIGEAGDGTWTIVNNFTVSSVGNDALSNINFSCYTGTVCSAFNASFTPINISSLPVGSKQSVSVNVSVPLNYTPGTYNGTVNVSAANDGWDTFILYAIVPAKTNVSIISTISSYTAINITQLQGDSFSFGANITDIKNGSARFSNISLSLPSGWTANSTFENCGTLIRDQSCYRAFNTSIPLATPPGSYPVVVRANWTHNDNTLGTNSTSITVTVASNPVINVSETNVTGIGQDAAERTIGNFTILSRGNDALSNVTFNCYTGTVCQNFTVEFIPPNVSSVAANSSYSVMVNVTVPLSFLAGFYNGTVNVSAANDGWDTFLLEVNVSENRTWTLSPDYCPRTTQQPAGLVCEVNVSNLGNVQINFTVSPGTGNYTTVNMTNFTVDRLGWRVFNITYNVSGAPPAVHNSTFLVDAVQAGSSPDNRTVIASLLPYFPPVISVTVLPSETEQNNTVRIMANVTSASGASILWTRVNVTRPNSTLDTLSMFLVNTSGNLTQWELTYPNGTNGSTADRGVYNLTVYSLDSAGNENNQNASFTIFIKLNIIISTLSGTYYQGDTGSIYYVVRNSSNSPLQGITVNFTIYNTNGNITHLTSNFQTNTDGTIIPVPTFSLSSDAVTGNYTLVSVTTIFDSVLNKTFYIQRNSSFLVLSQTVTVAGLFADIETAVVWYPNNVMRLGILVYNGEGKPVNPDTLNLTVYDPASNLYFTVNLSQMTQKSTGYYQYQYAMPTNTATGMYLAVVNATQGTLNTLKLKAFRVASGGPYDVRITLFENEVPQSSYLDFLIAIENKGEVTQDVFLEYWVTSASNITYYSTSEAVLTPQFTNQSFTRNAFIYSTQPEGTYYLKARVTYDGVQPSILANVTFIVTKAAPNVTVPPLIVTGAYPTLAATETIPASLFISKYNSHISLARGFTRIERVVVENNGQVELSNVTLLLLGLAPGWFNITPQVYKSLAVGASSIFLVEFNIPNNARVGEYGASLLANSGVVNDQKTIVVTIHESIEELLQKDIEGLRKDLEDLTVDTRVAEREGKDVSNVELLLGEIKLQIDTAEKNLGDKNTDAALDNIANARNLIEKARDVLNKLEPPAAEEKPLLPLWLIFLIIIAIAIAVYVIVQKKRKKPVLRPIIIPLGKLVESVKHAKKPVSNEDLKAEKDKLLRMSSILDREKAENMISQGAYDEMKKSIERKLAKVEEKLKSQTG